MIVNWTVRFKNKNFWLSFIPAILLLVQVLGSVFGYEFDFGDLGNKLVELVNAVFAVLVLLGVVNDPTTATLSDSSRALLYDVPKED